MSLFRNQKPDDKDEEPNQFEEASRARSEPSSDLLRRAEPPEAPRPAFTSFADREARAEVRATPTPLDKCTNVIAAGSRWKGSLNIDDSIRIDGQLSGDISAKGTVHIADGAHVEAKVRAAFVVISGSFKGEIRCEERLELMPASHVEGALVTKQLTVHEGATVDSSIQMSREAATPPRARETIKA